MNLIRPPSVLPVGSSVWAYLRDSGGESQEQSVNQQRAVIEDYCREYGLILTRVFADVARSGGSTVGRDQFNDLIDLSSKGSIRPAGLLLWNFARFARDLDDSSYYKAMLRKRGMVIHSLTDPIPEGDYSRLIESLIDFSNEEKRKQISRDVKRAFSALASQGYSVGGFPPMGYKADKKPIGTRRNGSERFGVKWIPDEDLAPVVVRAFELRSEGRSYEEITVATGGKLYKTDVSWCSFFRNKSYIGVGKCGSLLLPGHHEAIVSESLFNRVQDLTKKRIRIAADDKFHPRRVGNPSLLSGLAYCVHCGSAMSKETGGKNRWSFYICGRKKRERYSSCEGRQVNQAAADRMVIDLVLNQVLTIDYFDELLRECQARFDNVGDLDSEIGEVRKEIAIIEKKINNLRRAVEDGTESALDWLRDRENELARLRISLADMERRKAAASLKVSPEALNLVLDYWRGQLAGVQGSGDVRALKRLLSHFVERIGLGYNRIVVSYTYPICDLGQVNEKTEVGGTSLFTYLFCLPSREIELIWR